MEERKIAFKSKKAFCLILSLALLFVLCSFQVFAAEKIDTNADVSMSIQYNGKRGAVTGASFHVYHVADVTEDGEYVVNDAFKDYPIAFDGLTQEGWLQLATTLKGYVWKDQIKEVDGGKTNQEGTVTFPSKGVPMKPGLYLVLGDTRVIGSYTYYATPFLICLPGVDANGAQTNYQVKVAQKYKWDYDSPGNPSPGSSTISRKVLKKWDDNGNEALRPESIRVQLLRDGKVYSTAELNKGNNWRHVWYNLRKGHDWSVIEEDVSGYTVNVSQEGVTFVITNTRTPVVPDKPDTPDKPGSERPDKPDDMTWEEYNEWLEELGLMTPPGGNLYLPKLPQTGQLWWPVPILVCLGLVCMLIGAMRRRSAYEEE